MTAYKVLVTDYEYSTLAPEREVLEALGIELITAQCKTEEDVIEAAKGVDGIINQYAPITRKVIESLDKCQVIARYGIGFNTIDVEAASEKGIIVSNVTDYCIGEVSDHAFALLMACARKVVVLNQAVKSGNWDYKVSVPIFRLKGRTVGLVGLGNIPQSLVPKVQSLGMNVIAFDPFVPKEVADQLNVELTSLEELAERADFVSVHAPLNKQTEKMINKDFLGRMKKEAFVINTSRGPLIDEDALEEALEKGVIAGAALDVAINEPIQKDHPFLKRDNVILNPHAAWYSEEAEVELKTKTAQNVADVLSGYYPRYQVNRDVTPIKELARR